MTTWRQLSSKADYKRAVERINILMEAKRSDDVQNELTLLSYLVEEYEEYHYSLPDAPAHEVVKFVMEMKGLKPKDLLPILGSKGNVSKILNGMARIQIETLAPLSSLLGIPVEALIPKQNILTGRHAVDQGAKTAVADSSVQYKKRKK